MPRIRPFVNWGRNVQSEPQCWEWVHTEEELVRCVRKARGLGLSVKALGSRHSWSSIAAPDAMALEMHGYNEVLSIDKDSCQVTVQSGIRLRDLNRILDEQGLALPILGSVTAQTIAGATATGTHGSSFSHGPLSSLVEELRVVDGKGEIVTLQKGSEALEGGRVHLGALGLVSTVTLQVAPSFRLEETGGPMSWERALADLEVLARGEEYIKLWWLPHTDQVQVFRYRRTEKPSNFQLMGRWFDQAVINRWVFPSFLWAGRVWPDWIPGLNRFLEPQYFKPFCRVGRSFDVLTLAMPPVHREMEYAVPMERAAEALLAVREMMEREKLHVNFILEVRFVPKSESWMSPSYGQDACHIGLYMAASRDLETYFRLGQDILWEHGGRPHWGKEFARDPAALLERYPKFSAFRALSKRLDPEGMFHNPFLRTLFSA